MNSSSARSRVAVIGDALIEEVHDEAGENELIGGSAVNVAVGLSRLGVPSILLAAVGRDDAGERIRAHLELHGVELMMTPSRMGTGRTVSGGGPSHEFDDAARARCIRLDEQARSALEAAPLTVISGFPFDRTTQTLVMLKTLERRTGRLAIDPNPRAGLLRSRAEFVRGLERMAATADLVRLSDEDAGLLYETSAEHVRARMLGAGARAVLTTTGAGGSTIETANGVIGQRASAPAGSSIDTMGTGDAAFAAILAAMDREPPSDMEGWSRILRSTMDIADTTGRPVGTAVRPPSDLAQRAGDDRPRLMTPTPR